MKPGRELDALVAEKVMGWISWRNGREETLNPPLNESEERVHGIYPKPEIPHYSTSIADAWQVVEAFDVYHISKTIVVPPARWFHATLTRFDKDQFGAEAGESIPHAVCLAALAACGVKFE